MKTDAEIIDELKAETRAAVAAGLRIDMMTTALTTMQDTGVWRPVYPTCPRCVVGFHLSNRAMRDPVASDVETDLALEYERSFDWAKGLMDGTTPGMGSRDWLGGDYPHGFDMGRQLLEWVETELHGWVVS